MQTNNGQDLIARAEVIQDHFDRIHEHKARPSFSQRHKGLLIAACWFFFCFGVFSSLAQFVRLIIWLTEIK